MTWAGRLRRRALHTAISAAAFLIVHPSAAHAQFYVNADVPRAGSVEIAGGGAWLPGHELESVAADETRNTGTGTGPFTLFSTDTRVGSAFAARGRAAVYLANAVSLEGGVSFARPVISTRITGDAESAPDVTAKDTLTQLVFDGSAVLHLTAASFDGGRGVPFVLGGGGYIRELHEKNEVMETGHEYHVGAGLHVWSGHGRHRVGFRADVAVSRRTGGADGPGKKRTAPAAGASIAYLF